MAETIFSVIATIVTYLFIGMIVSAWYCKSDRGSYEKSEKLKAMRLAIALWPMFIVFMIIVLVGELFYSLASLVWDLVEKDKKQ